MCMEHVAPSPFVGNSNAIHETRAKHNGVRGLTEVASCSYPSDACTDSTGPACVSTHRVVYNEFHVLWVSICQSIQIRKATT